MRVNVRSACSTRLGAAHVVRGARLGTGASDAPSATDRRVDRTLAGGLLDLLAPVEPPAFAVDQDLRIVFWNGGAERVLGRSARQVLGRHCYEVMVVRDARGNRCCHAGCALAATTRGGSPLHGLEVAAGPLPGAPDRRLTVTIAAMPGSRPGGSTILHLLGSGESAGGTTTRTQSPWPPARRHGSLTGREREVLGWIADGLQNKEIAERLAISVATVRNHVHNLLAKLGAHSKLEGATLAFRLGWVGTGGGAADPQDAAQARPDVPSSSERRGRSP
jgi:DNA-binding CsgD family transcriptional regulator